MQQLTDNFLIKGQITENDFIEAASLGISLIINNRPDGEEPGILSVTEAENLAQQHNIEYIHLPMANGQPLPEDLIPNMQQAIQQQNKVGGKILAHCRSGTRSSFLWGVIQILEGKMDAMQVIDTAAKAGINLAGFAPYLQHVEQQT